MIPEFPGSVQRETFSRTSYAARVETLHPQLQYMGIEPLGTLFDYGGLQSHSIKKISAFMCSGSPYRNAAFDQMIDRYSQTVHIQHKQLDGPNIEIGQNPSEKAVGKVLDSWQQLIADKYPERHPDEATILYAADSQDYVIRYDGVYLGWRDKPRDLNTFKRYGEEWVANARGYERHFAVVGYAALIIVNGMGHLLTEDEQLRLITPDHKILQSFYFQSDRFAKARSCNHGLTTEIALQNGHEVVLNGSVWQGQKAVNGVYGANVERFNSLQEKALAVIDMLNDIPF